MAKLIPLAELSPGFAYPAEYLRVVDLGLIDLEPWRIVEGRTLFAIYEPFADAFPNEHLVSSVRFTENDDVVCWHPAAGEIVTVDPSDRHWYSNGNHENFWAWFRRAIRRFDRVRRVGADPTEANTR
jgi:hypothetical protein